jgi:hypothetical protein
MRDLVAGTAMVAATLGRGLTAHSLVGPEKRGGRFSR